MSSNEIREASLERAKRWPGARYIGSDFLLVESPGQAPFPHNARRTSFILVGLCTHGGASYTVDTEVYHIKAGDVVIISDGHVVDNFAPVDGLDGLCMMLSSDFFGEAISSVADFSQLLLFSRMHPVVSLSAHEMEVFSSYYRLLSDKLGDETSRYRREVARALFLAMFYDMSGVIYRELRDGGRRPSRGQLIFTEFIRLVEAHHRTERRVGWYAMQLCITPKYLSEVVKAVSMVTPSEWIDRYVVLAIRLLLRRSDKTVKEIADELLFPSQSFMGRFFKEHTGMSPSQFRKER